MNSNIWLEMFDELGNSIVSCSTSMLGWLYPSYSSITLKFSNYAGLRQFHNYVVASQIKTPNSLINPAPYTEQPGKTNPKNTFQKSSTVFQRFSLLFPTDNKPQDKNQLDCLSHAQILVDPSPNIQE